MPPVSNRFVNLPPELVSYILEELPYKDLLSCKLVCSALYNAVSISTSLLYKIDLAIAGLEDNLEHPLRRQAKRALLGAYQDAWARVPQLSARQSNSMTTPIDAGPAWELAGGVLGQSVGQNKLRFNRLGSKLRGVSQQAWNVDLGFNLRDFTMDPGQDLLVVLREPQGMGNLYSLNLLSMFSGKPHPLANAPELSLPFNRADDFEIRVNGSLVGLLVMHALHDGDETESWSPVSVWDWKTGQQIFAFEQEYVCSFVFLSDKYILLAHMVPPEENGALSVIELANPPSENQQRWTFLLPPCRKNFSVIESMELLCDPGPQWTPSAHPSSALVCSVGSKSGDECDPEGQCPPPFFITHEDRIISLMMTVMDERSPYLDPYTIRFAISSAKLLNFMHQTDSTPTYPLSWPVWGPQSTRAEPRNDIWDGNWPCCVYGTRMVMEQTWVEDHNGQVKRYRPESLIPTNYDVVMGPIEIYDFNQLALKYALTKADAATSSQASSLASMEPVDYQDVKPLHIDGYDYYVQPTHLPKGFDKFFADPDNVTTSLPYRVCHTRISPHREGQKQERMDNDPAEDVDIGAVSSVMLSEDSVVLVREGNEDKPDFFIINIQ